MKALIQRVREASVVTLDNTEGPHRAGAIGAGLLVLLGIAKSDTMADAIYLSDRVLGLRIFPDEAGKMNRNIVEAGGQLLIVSQFTLYGDCRKGRRPSFDAAASPEQALFLYNYLVNAARRGPVPVETGTFQAAMQVQ